VVDYTSNACNGNAKQIIQDILLKKLNGPDTEGPPGCCSHAEQLQSRIYYTSFSPGYSVIQMCSEKYPVKHSLGFQKEIGDAFAKSGHNAQDSDCKSFRDILRAEVKRYTENPPQNKVDKVKEKQEAVKQVLIEDIEAAVKRHGQIEIVLEGTEDLAQESERFKTSSSQVRRTVQCQLYKTYAMIAAITIVIIAVLIGIICAAAGC